jgi:hypothetical protein
LKQQEDRYKEAGAAMTLEAAQMALSTQSSMEVKNVAKLSGDGIARD